jgi:hypothetical protein
MGMCANSLCADPHAYNYLIAVLQAMVHPWYTAGSKCSRNNNLSLELLRLERFVTIVGFPVSPGPATASSIREHRPLSARV